MRPGDLESPGLPTSAFEIVEGLPQPRSYDIRDPLGDGKTDDEIHAGWTTFCRVWLERLRDALGDGYELVESEDTLLLSGRDAAWHDPLLRCVDRVEEMMRDCLGEDGSRGGAGKLVCVAFADTDRFHDFVSFHDDEGEYGTLSGASYASTIDLVALNTCVSIDFLEGTLVREVCRVFVCNLDLPMWLHAGVTQLLPDLYARESSLRLDRETVQAHHGFWRMEGLRGFWAGETFGGTGEGAQLSWELAAILVIDAFRQDREAFFRFVREAKSARTGEDASRRVLGVRLAAWATPFLGEGDWGP